MSESAAPPSTEYQTRLARRRSSLQESRAVLDRLGQWRLAIFLVGIATAVVGSISKWYHPTWCFVAILPYLATIARSQGAARAARKAERSCRFFQQGLERLDGKWTAVANDGSRYQDPEHLYAADLDLFGPGSCFQYLNAARTQLGQTELANWLKAPADRDEILSRQGAVGDLAGRLDLREELATCGVDAPSGVELARFLAWGKQPGRVISRPRRAWIFLLGYVNVLAALGWALFDTTSLPLLMTFTVSLVSVWSLRQWAREVLRPLDELEKNLSLIETLLRTIEQESFHSPRLQRMQQSLRSGDQLPSEQMYRLHRLIDQHDAGKNGMFIPFRILLLWDVRIAFHLEDWRRDSGSRIEVWFRAMADLEALLSLAAYHYENPADPFPEIADGPAALEAASVTHPLLRPDRAVRNDVRLDPELRLLMVSGSNMSGKSTLLRSLGLNVVLALAGAPVRAERMKLTPMNVGATIRVQDSLQDGKSRFFAEVSRVRAILKRAEEGGLPLLFLLDELFAGTNSSDRERGAEGVLKKLMELNSLGLVTTHDLALTQIGERFGKSAANVHFADDVVNGELHFDYRMKSGVVPHGNGVALMRMVGLDV